MKNTSTIILATIALLGCSNENDRTPSDEIPEAAGTAIRTDPAPDWPSQISAAPAPAATTGALFTSMAAIEVYKSPTCECCAKWIGHLGSAGMKTTSRNEDNMPAIKDQAGVPTALRSCHTGKAGGYVIEGHVPAADIARLLAEKPDIAGIAVPGMPVGSPGMEGGTPQPYQVIAFKRDGSTYVFASH